MTSSKVAEGQERNQSVEEKEEGYQWVSSMGHGSTSYDDSKKEAIEEEECVDKEAIEEEWRVWLRAYENQSNSNGDISFYEKLQDLLYQSVEGEYWKILLEAYEKVPLARKATLSSSGNQTAFHLLVGRSTATKVVEEVLRHVDGDDVKIKDDEGNTVLHAAAAKGIINIDICKLIHFRFPDLIKERNDEGKTALSLFTTGLIKDPYNESWNTAVDGYEALINILNLTTLPPHSTPLHMAVTYSFFHREDGMETFKKVKEKEIMLKIKNENGYTALHLAAEYALDDLCKSMADACPELVNIDNFEGETPLFIAARRFTINNFRNLYKYANPSTIDMPSGDDNTILHCALQSENLDIAYYILRKHSSFRSSPNLDDLTPLKILAKIPYAFRSRTPLTMVEQIIYSCIWVVDLEEPRKNEVDYCRQELSKCFNIVKRLMTSGPQMMSKVLSSRSCCSDLEKLDQDHNIEGKENFKDTSTKHAHSEDIPADSEDRVESVIASLEHLSRREKRVQEPRPLRKRVSNYCVKCMSPIKSFIKRCMALIKRFIKTCIVLIKSFIKTCLAPFMIANSFLIKHLLPGELVGKTESIKRRNMLAYKIMEKLLKYEASCEDPFSSPGNATALIAAKKGIIEMVEGILRINPRALICTRKKDSKNAMLVAIENRQADTYVFLTNLEKKGIEIPKWTFGGATDHKGNNALHLAATKSSRQPWGMPTTLQLLWEIKWYNTLRQVRTTRRARRRRRGKRDGSRRLEDSYFGR